MRAREPDSTGFVERDSVRLAYEVFGDAPHTVLLMPTWSIITSRSWKAQVPYLARRYRVVTFDGRGSGASDRPVGERAYLDEEFVADALAVLDATRRGPDDTAPVAVVGFSCGVAWSLALALEARERVAGIVAIGPAVGLVPGLKERDQAVFLADPPEPADAPRTPDLTGWASYNRHTWLHGDYDAFLRFFFGRMYTEPHSTKQIEDCVGWGHEIGPERLVDTELARTVCRRPGFAQAVTAVDVPLLVIHGDDDHVRPSTEAVALADAMHGSLLTIEGGGHAPHSREPVVVNRAMGRFLERLWPGAPDPVRTTWTRAGRRTPRALFLTSPIGLGHVRRDIAIADALRKRRPELQIDWLTQAPATGVLERAGERVHPASAHLASECAHIEDEAAEHDLHAFQAIRRMDEILVANFGVFDDLVSAEPYDLVVGDEAWDVDYYLHENPELKRFAFAWLTDFVGWMPMPDGGAAEAALTADYNAEMLEQRARLARIRDRSLFVGNPADVVDQTFGPGLPGIREWTQDHFAFTGYVTGFEPVSEADRAAIRATVGVGPDELLCVVTVGGSGVGEAFLRRVLDAVPRLRREEPRLRFLVVTGPRIDPRTLPRRRGVHVRGFVPDLHRHLGAADVALVQGGLTTCMELTAQRVPFVYVPLRHHFEQNVHVPQRLAQYGAGRRLAYEDAVDPDQLTAALLAELRTVPAGPAVETDGADRAAAMLADLV
ncbi:alpha/beta fold hydrolase [Mumia zhuanghuii]|uniref:Alpha/beta fold hydrolase n=2 Tax=Mumia TaxID=1546255 RepID=A0ABW1QFJ9_9ACTN|nr:MULTISPECIES: alpha/beta hydrolase [Mumia]KAA1422667.1 alpha/beta fold hydrolase [Mumia zhuanghuii]